jgi:hypothetical protein
MIKGIRIPEEKSTGRCRYWREEWFGRYDSKKHL